MKKSDLIIFTLLVTISVFTALIYNNTKALYRGINTSRNFLSKILYKIDKTPNVSAESRYIIHISTDKTEYYRFELVRIRISIKSGTTNTLFQDNISDISCSVFYNGKLVETIGKTQSIRARYNVEKNIYECSWFPPWNPELGKYTLIASIRIDNKIHQKRISFKYVKREIRKLSPLCISALEHNGLITNKRYNFIEEEGSWKKLLDWNKYIGSDGIFALAGITKSDNRNVNYSQPFYEDKILEALKIGAEAHKRGLKFGAWIQSFGIQGGEFDRLGYKPSLGYKNGKVVANWHVSLNSEKRIKDIIKLVKRLSSSSSIDMIGLDYIRTGSKDGFEMASDFVKDMDVEVPNKWSSYSSDDKAKWLYFKVMGKNRNLNIKNKWRWWRAHKTAEIVSRIIRESGTSKPIWVFTLGWRHGQEHGQDPLMMMDAGVAFDAVMLYEASRFQFINMMHNWGVYTEAKNINILIGETTDVYFLDSDKYAAPYEMYLRSVHAAASLNFGGYVNGIFWHDLYRIFYGRIGYYKPIEWFVSAGSTFSTYGNMIGRNPLKAEVSIDKEYGNKVYLNATFSLINISEKDLPNVKVEILSGPGARLSNSIKKILIKNIKPAGKKVIKVRYYLNIPTSRKNAMIGIRAEQKGMPSFAFKYIDRYKDPDYSIQHKVNEESHPNLEEIISDLNKVPNKNFNNSTTLIVENIESSKAQ